MSCISSEPFLKQNPIFFLNSHKASKSIIFLLALINFAFLSCSPTKRFTENEDKTDKIEKGEESTKNIKEKESETEFNFAEIRVSMQGLIPSESLLIESQAYLYDEESVLALVNSGSTINCFDNAGKIQLDINEQRFDGQKFFLASAESEEIIKLNGKRYRGKIQISFSSTSIDVINILNLEDYVKGVLAKEMPLGKNGENFEALKALAICVRTYAIQKIKDGKLYFDIYPDTRDQVYGGVDSESTNSNKAVDETNNLILKYEGNAATIFYHSTCGGYTESSVNVFTREEIPYLTSVKDGDEPNCKISPRFQWEEKYSRELIVSRLKNYSLLDNQNYSLEDISVISRFNSGRVDELEIDLVGDDEEETSVIIRGNEIRSIIRNADGKSILWSTMFDVSLNSNSVIILGKGFGHGVGLCQWGAIALSRKGWDFTEILYHYYPGTIAEKIND
ncbi:MAG: SpoIID/LytB domain-containing protein [Ignavibacteria bacterium]|nr:SpoIID/LytB domain-containing protein [Ignavibacteria bacterium]